MKGLGGRSDFRASCPGGARQLNWPELEIYWDGSLRVILSLTKVASVCSIVASPHPTRSQAPYRRCPRGWLNHHKGDGTSKWMPWREQDVMVVGILPVRDDLHLTSQNSVPENSMCSLWRQELRVLTWSLCHNHELFLVKFCLWVGLTLTSS